MTVAGCYVSPEGIILGADSTTSAILDPGGFHYYNYNQKLFEVGENSTLGIVTWGLGGLGDDSHRTLIARLADELSKNPPASVDDVASRWVSLFWTAYQSSPLIQPLIQLCQTLGTKAAFDPNAAAQSPNARTEQEEQQFLQLTRGLVVGFCVGGYVTPDRTPKAFEVVFEPLQKAQPAPRQVPNLGNRFWGAPNIIGRLINGIDHDLRNEILNSKHWNGTDTDLDALITQNRLAHPIVPIREAIDFVHACIYSTIKAMKFSNLSQICGGPIELAVITSDRRFRWVRHKDWDSAIHEGTPI